VVTVTANNTAAIMVRIIVSPEGFVAIREESFRLKSVNKGPDFATRSASSGQNPVSQSKPSEPGGSDGPWT
jgi:hypothetical protein